MALTEAMDASKAEIDNLNNSAAAGSSDSSLETKAMLEDAELNLQELEEKYKQILPMITLVDNMVKLGSLYKSAPPADSMMVTTRKNNIDKQSATTTAPSKNLEFELKKVHSQLDLNQKLLEDLANEHSRWEEEVEAVTNHAVHSANQDLEQGLRHPSNQTLEIEADMRQAQENCNTIKKRIQDVAQEIQNLHTKQDYLTHEIRPSPTGVIGAEPVPSKRKPITTYLQTDIDSGISFDRSHETEAQLKMEFKSKSSGSTYVNAYHEDSDHNYENTKYDDEADEVQTVHSEGVRSEAPPIPPKTNNAAAEDISSSSSEMYSLGDISEADERVKKFYGLIPKNQIQACTEIKTVRMVKRDSKERSVSRQEQQMMPIPPRGNYQNVHDFLNAFHQQQSTEESLSYNLKANTLPKATDKENILPANVTAAPAQVPQSRSAISLAQYYHNKGKEEKSVNSSAYERLFGSSRETSLSPPESPSKRMIRGSSGESSLSPIMSPVFKSDAARAIVQEVGVVGGAQHRRVHRRIKKRSLTITSSHPAVLEALQDRKVSIFKNSHTANSTFCRSFFPGICQIKR